jgi:integrase/recombinase XerD
MTFKEYMMNKDYTDLVIGAYGRSINLFLKSNPKASQYTYKNIIEYFAGLRSDGASSFFSQRTLFSVKKYYDYLIETGVRIDHPCRTLSIRKHNYKQLIWTDLFSSKELEKLVKNQIGGDFISLRNRMLLSLMIYQGLTGEDLILLKLSSINLRTKAVQLKSTRILTKRSIQLVPKQVRLLRKYLKMRNTHLLKKGMSSDKLLINKFGQPVRKHTIRDIVDDMNYLYDDRKLTSQKIRQSVISNWINQQKIPLDKVQVIAGHKWVSSTFRYRHPKSYQQRETIDQFHPLNV